MKIGLIIPYKNAKPWLERCLNSIGAQPFEVYLVNDHSTDQGPYIATSFSRGFHYIDLDYLERGVAMARNKGLEAALADGCDFVTFLDSDDELTPDAFEKMEQAIAQEPDEAIIQFNHYAIDANGWKFPRLQNNKGTYTLGNLPKLWVSCVNKIFRADLVRSIGFDPDLRHGEDEIFVLQCLAMARRLYHSERFTMLYHRDNPKSLSKSTTLRDLAGEQVALIAVAITYDDDPEMLAAIRTRQAELWNNAVYKRIFGGER
ncbi:MAG: glycosyltransferase family 2 protein [Lachnospiraceae bacterium]|nr:glycosyltransferase family 2 protein [Lachnospiraceae bacterium]